MKKKKVLILIPPLAEFMREARCQAPLEKVMVEYARFPLTSAYIAAIFIKNNFECRFHDYAAEKLDWQAVDKEIRDFSPDMLISSLTKYSAENDKKAFILAKSIDPNIKTVGFGGELNLAEKIMRDCQFLDIYIKGEPEIACEMISSNKSLSEIKGIAYRYEEEITARHDMPNYSDINELPFPAREIINNELYIRPDINLMQTEIEVSRGCSYSCIFCLAPIINGRKVRLRRPKKIVEEIEQCVDRFKIRDFFFRADVFTADKNWVLDLCELIKAGKLKISWCCNSRVDAVDQEMLQAMKSSGCWLISFGIESGVEEILGRIKKQIRLEDCRKAISLCKKIKIKTYVNFMIGFPWDNKKTIKQTLRFAKKLDADFAEFPMVMPFYGTALYEILKQNDIIKDNQDTPLPIKTKYLNEKQVMSLWRNAVLSYYLRPKFIIKTLLMAAKEGKLLRYFKIGTIKIFKINKMRFD